MKKEQNVIKKASVAEMPTDAFCLFIHIMWISDFIGFAFDMFVFP